MTGNGGQIQPGIVRVRPRQVNLKPWLLSFVLIDQICELCTLAEHFRLITFRVQQSADRQRPYGCLTSRGRGETKLGAISWLRLFRIRVPCCNRAAERKETPPS
jgi:hypothetical protein